MTFNKVLSNSTLAAMILALSACSGSDGAQGSPGPPGPPAPPPTVDINDAVEINAAINSARISGQPVVTFTLADGNGIAVTGLPASSISFKLAQLRPGTDGNASAWQSYINQLEQPGAGPGTEAKVQATTENGANGALTDNNDGTYSYSFAVDVTTVTDPIVVDYIGTLTHRVSFEIRGFAPVRNPAFDIRPSDSATSGIFTREIANIDNCNACHDNLALHGGARFEMQECVLCHNPGSGDANSGNTVDMKVMTHKIHRGMDLPSVIGGEDYCIYGFRDSLHCYGDVVYPQSIRNCVGCHDGADPETPDAANWYEQPTVEACGACHDDVNFVTGENHGPGIPADNTQCISCHATNPNSGIEVRNAHRMLTVEQRDEYLFNILAIDFQGAGSTPTATFSITNPQNGNTPYDLANDPVMTASLLRFRVAWSTLDYSNAGNGASNAQPPQTEVFANGVLQATDNGDFTYSIGLTPVAAGVSGSGIITLEGRIAGNDGDVEVQATFDYIGITDDPANPVARRVAVDMQRCNDCHSFLSFHGGARNNLIENCQVCHNADAARGGSPSRGPMDMKHFVHRKHAVDDIRYPQRVSNCTACHVDGGFYPVATDSGVLASSFDRGAVSTDPTDNTRTSANSAACGVCHSSASAQAHFTQNGGSFDACQETDGTLRERLDFCGPGGNKTGANVAESCTVCHAEGRTSDVATVHSID